MVGDAGVGKSRLAAEFLASVEAPIVRGRCLPYGEGITYWPVVEVLKQLDALPSDPAAAASLRSLLGETGARNVGRGDRLGVPQAARGAGAPLVCVFDDIQWGEETFLDLVEHVALLSSRAPILLLCMARPELCASAGPAAGRSRSGSSRFAEDAVDELIPERFPPSCASEIAHAAGGNPLFIDRDGGDGREATGEVAVPPTCRRCSPRASTSSRRRSAPCSSAARSKGRSSTAARCRLSPPRSAQ